MMETNRVYSLLAIFLIFGTVDTDDHARLNSLELAAIGENLLKEMCVRQGVDYNDLLATFEDNFLHCIDKKSSGLSILLPREEEALRYDARSACQKWTDFVSCFQFNNAPFFSCMIEEEQMAFNKTLNLSNDLLEFLCFDNGKRLQIVDKGIQCMGRHENSLSNCFTSLIDIENISLASLMAFTKKACLILDKSQQCFVKQIEQCSLSSDSTNLIDGAFKAAKMSIPCKE